MRTDPNCIFCKIVAGDIPAKKVHETTDALVFEDLNPAAPVHLLVIPKEHIATINDVADSDQALMGALFTAASQGARMKGIADSGYRLVANVNRDAGQEVFHIHMHLLGGQKMGWPPV